MVCIFYVMYIHNYIHYINNGLWYVYHKCSLIMILELSITSSTSIYYLLSDIIISNEIYTVTISATNGASTGNETMYTKLILSFICYNEWLNEDNCHIN